MSTCSQSGGKQINAKWNKEKVKTVHYGKNIFGISIILQLENEGLIEIQFIKQNTQYKIKDPQPYERLIILLENSKTLPHYKRKAYLDVEMQLGKNSDPNSFLKKCFEIDSNLDL